MHTFQNMTFTIANVLPINSADNSLSLKQCNWRDPGDGGELDTHIGNTVRKAQ
ncbi:hypothetical protein KIN20_024627 [Parelaphostrongylus tenuis]|uniref:Uncharacterized protein n=1 Tax=Parelaphostrongylus tenuis TaxID=148309 RepID=A0AAD5N7S4_PARTN|nr:hypothetical protein KIN20_024627 [Parelaphostrongylus tenuis]